MILRVYYGTYLIISFFAGCFPIKIDYTRFSRKNLRNEVGANLNSARIGISFVKSNRYTLGAFSQRVGADPVYLGLCADDFDHMINLVNKALSQAETVWISGGSSVGTRDLTLKVFEALHDFELLVHGISISPGKPTIIGRSGSQPVIGLPGHVASAMVVADIFLRRLILRLSGRIDVGKGFRPQMEAVLTRNIESQSGREDYIRVKLLEKEGALTVEPVFGKSGLISTLVDADGVIRIGMNREGLYEGQSVEVILFG